MPSIVRKNKVNMHKETKARDGKHSISTQVPGSRGAWDQQHPCPSWDMWSDCSADTWISWVNTYSLCISLFELGLCHGNLRVMKICSSTAKSSHLSWQPELPKVAPVCTDHPSPHRPLAISRRVDTCNQGTESQLLIKPSRADNSSFPAVWPYVIL